MRIRVNDSHLKGLFLNQIKDKMAVNQGYEPVNVPQGRKSNESKKAAVMTHRTDLIDAMNSLLEESLAAQNQNMVHAEICGGWGYKKLELAFRTKIIIQMHESEGLIERIIFLGGSPGISKLNTIIKLGKTVAEMLGNEKGEEKAVLKAYNKAIVLARKASDQGSVELLTRILKMEEQQARWVETQQVQIKQMGLENYLINQTENAVN